MNPGDWRKVPSILEPFRCIFMGYELQILMCLNVFWVLCSSDHIWLSFQDTQSFFHPNIDVYLLLCALVKKWNEAAAIRTKFPRGFVWGLSKRILHFARGFACEWLDSYQICSNKNMFTVLPSLFTPAFLNKSCPFAPSENMERCLLWMLSFCLFLIARLWLKS